MNGNPAGAGCDGNPRRRLEIAAGETRLRGLSSCSSSVYRRKTFSARSERVDPIRQNSNVLNRERRQSRLADFTSKTGETLRCVRSGGPGPNASPVVTGDRREPTREAVRSRSPRGAESGGWREVAEWCHATEGSGHE